MLGRTLQLYIAKYFLRTTLFFFIGIGLLVFLVDFTEINNRMNNLSGYSSTIGLSLAGLRLPFIMQVALPFVTLSATMTTLMQLNKKNELVVARSVGVSAWQFLLPIWVAAFLLGCLAVTVINPLAANTYSLATETENSFRGKPASSGPLSNNKPWLRQSDSGDGVYLIGAERSSSNGITLLDATFLHLNADGDIIERFDAPRATLDGENWVLNQANRSKAGEKSQPVGRTTIPTNLDPAVISQALIPAELIPFFKLSSQISTANSFGIPANPYKMQYYSLIALPLLLISMTLIAATVSLRFVRFGQSSAMILGGVFAGFVLYVLTEVTKSFGSAGIVQPIIAAWLPVLVTSMFGVAFLLHREDG